VLKRLLDDEADLVLDPRDVGGVCRPGAHRHLVIGKTLALAIADAGEAL
jgi:hypothetical protein